MTPRLVLTGEQWRVVAVERPDEHGVLREQYVIELTEPRDKDALGTQRWNELTGKSAMGDWVRVTRRLLDELLKSVGEQPNSKER